MQKKKKKKNDSAFFFQKLIKIHLSVFYIKRSARLIDFEILRYPKPGKPGVWNGKPMSICSCIVNGKVGRKSHIQG